MASHNIRLWLFSGLLIFNAFPSLLAQPIKAKFYQPIIPTIKWPCTISAVGDVNNDGRNDMLMGTTHNSNALGHHKLMIHLQNVRTTLNTIPFSYSVNGDTISSIKTADLNGDHRTDVLVGAGDEVAIFIQDTAIKLKRDTLMYSGRGVRDVQIGDLNQDGKSDFVVFHARENFVRVFYQDTNGTFYSQTYPCTGSDRGEVDIADMNGDGLPDILAMTSRPPALQILHGKGQQQFDPAISLSSATGGAHTFEAMATGDFFQDGLTDIAISRNQGDSLRQVEFFSQTPAGLQQFTIANQGGECLNAVDLNCDGIPDLLSLFNGVYDIYISNPFHISYFNQADPGTLNGLITEKSFSYGSPMRRKFDPGAVSHGDINSDGITDIVIADTAYGILYSYNKTQLQPRILGDSVFYTDITVHTDTFSTTVSHHVSSTMDTLFGYYLSTAYIQQIKSTYLVRRQYINTSKVIFKTYCTGNFNDTVYNTEVLRDASLVYSDTTIVEKQTKIEWQQKDYDRHLAVYPNPTSGRVFIEILKAGNLLHNLRIGIYGSDGKYISTHTISFTGKGEIDLHGHARGTYHLAIEWLGRNFDRSIIKQ